MRNTNNAQIGPLNLQICVKNMNENLLIYIQV